jgi:hypothetical protein
MRYRRTIDPQPHDAAELRSPGARQLGAHEQIAALCRPEERRPYRSRPFAQK